MIDFVKQYLLVPVLSVLVVMSATAQISTDRPGFAFAPSTVGQGVFQVELGTPDAIANSFSNGDAQLYQFPMALRFGVTEAIELRLGTTLLNILRGGGESSSEAGFDVLEAGAKINLLSGANGGATFSVIPSVLIPTEGGSVVGLANGVVGYALPNAFNAIGVAGVVIAEDDVASTLVGLLGRSLTDALSGYVEVVAFPQENATPVYVGAGLTLLVNPDAQVDAFFDRGLNDEANDWLFGGGISFRLR